MVLRAVVRTLFALAAATFLPAGVHAGAASAPAALDARAWLTRIHGAASQRNYEGTLVVSSGGVLSSSRIAHYSEGNHNFERIEMLDGERRQVFRHDDLVHTVWPASRVAVIEQRDPLVPFPSLLRAGEDQLFERYELKAEGADRVADHDTLVFLLQPRDKERFAQRLWADKNTGLLLRTDVIGTGNTVLESSAFTDVTIGGRPHPDSVLKPMKKLAGYKVFRPTLTSTQLEAEGWSLASPVQGFRQIRCVKRPLEETVAPADVLQSIFSDGLTHVSVFIEPYNAERHKPAQGSIGGATHTLMQQRDKWWVTVMGDVPMGTLKQFSEALKRVPR
jgi:sigma-E factor negative regulatory protein RseB